MLRCLCRNGNAKWRPGNMAVQRNSLQNHSRVQHLSAQPSLKKERKSDEAKGIFNTGNVYSGFLCTDVQEIKEFNMTAISLKHQKSNTEYLHLQRDDPNNVFSVNFRTTPFNSTGLPHILEHTVLCGSQRFPVRDPFFKMLNRSLATFMNAMTGPDYTLYPFSSQNEVDYRNLQSIYLDAVFKPNLNAQDFLQEGWRLEYADIKNQASDIGFKGVVFNEMKGAFSENSSVFGQKFLNKILPDHTYGYVSGGDPLDIPNLTLKELKDFHSMYYHPSNARIYSYGNFPLERNLEICDNLYLNGFEGIDSSYSKVPPQPRWGAPKEELITSRFDKMGAPLEKQNQIAIGYLMNDITDVYETFVLQVLSMLMVSGPNSPFYKSLIEPNISGGYSSMIGYDNQMKDTMFVVGLQDLEVANFDRVKSLVNATFSEIIDKGFAKSHVDSVLHLIELSLKHQHTRFGLNTLFNITALWNHDGRICDMLQVTKNLNRFKDNLKNPRYLSERVEFYFMRNNHKLTLTMMPDEAYEAKAEQMENALLLKKIAALSDKDKNKVFNDGLKLAETQKKKENVDILPCLQLKDIPKELGKINLKNINIASVPVQICEANTNEVTYFKGVLNMSDLSDNLKMLVPLFNATVAKMDTKKHGYRDFDQNVNMKTGGLGFSCHVVEKIDDATKFEQGVVISSHSLDGNVEAMFDIWADVFDKPVYKDVERFTMLLENYMSNLTNGIADSGHVYAMLSSSSLVKESSNFRERLTGLKHIEYMKNLLKNETPEEIMKRVSKIADFILDGDRLRTALNVTDTKTDKVVDIFDKFIKKINKNHDKKSICVKYTQSKDLLSTKQCVHHVMNIPINFCGKAVVAVPFTHKDYAKLKVLAKFLSSKYLHPVVREQNGAYGGGCKISGDGIFNFYSYRDPNSKVTLDVFDASADWFKTNHGDILNEQSLFEAKLGVLQQLDAPVAEFYKGIDQFLAGLSLDHLQRHRNDVLNVSKQDLIEVCERYLSENAEKKTNVGKCVIGPESDGNVLKKEGEVWEVFRPTNEG